ncbi:adhesion G protein-coupled receptor E5-like isoform X1 [Ranitomeya imitator]|uniref:adhesion G protein-coupled receptor E5-like isoform X1 n=1 Tax=Ranitomeya imitator TaxID=111125 RepID=UPI0037E8C0A8
MLRFWNSGIFLITLLINGLQSTTSNTISSTGSQIPTSIILKNTVNQNSGFVHGLQSTTSNTISSTVSASLSTSNTNVGNTGVSSTLRSSHNLTCLKLPPNTTNCNNHTCPEGQLYDKSFPCIPGYKKENDGDCVEVNECRDGIHQCDAYAECKNIQSGYYCECKKGFQRENVTEFCPSEEKKLNKCTDINECRNSPGICGSNFICHNTHGSYNCTCDNGFTNVSNICVVKCIYNTSKENCVDESFQCKLKNFTDNFTPLCQDVPSQQRLSMEEFLKGLDDLINGFSYGSKTDRLQNVGHLLNRVEVTIQNLALLEQRPMSHIDQNKMINIQVSTGTSDNGILSLQATKSNVQLDSRTAAGNTGLALLGCIEYNNITHLLEEADLLEEKSTNKSFKLVSPVVSVFLGIGNTSSLQQPLSLRVNITEKGDSRKFTCVSWSESNNSWSSRGCVMLKRDNSGVTCNCTHLTSFAVLMLLHDYETWALTLITQIGLSISILCLVLAIITFCFCRSIRGTRNTIHTHLCISLLFGNCIFLFGITAVWNQVLCRIIAALLHALYLCSFCWMALEGLELYRMLVTVFNTHLKKTYLLAVGYGTPAVIIIISAATYHQGYGTKKYCWLSLENGFIWAFMGPVCVIILVNCGIFVLTVWKLADKMSSLSPEQGKLKRIRTLTVTSLAQLCILGSCWVFGFFMFSSATPFFVYAFTILNTLQGLQIFCLHCLMHKKVRAEYKMWLCALAHFKAPVYSEFSNTSNTQTHSKAKAGKESGL